MIEVSESEYNYLLFEIDRKIENGQIMNTGQQPVLYALRTVEEKFYINKDFVVWH